MERVLQIFGLLRGRSAMEPITGPRLSLGVSLFILFFDSSYFMWKHFHGGIHPPHLMFIGAIGVLYFATPSTRSLLFLAWPLAVYGIIYDSFQYIPFARLQPIHVADIFHLDLRLFGIHWHGQVIPLHEFLFQHFANPFWDLVCGAFYLAHVPMAVIFLLIFWRFRSAELAGKFSMAFMIMNIMAFLTYYFYPAAAPWYVAKYGFLQPVGLVAGDPAGLARFDHLLGIDLFSSNYKISPVTFGAVPSMHVGVSTLIMLFSFHLGKKWGAVMGLYVALMGFSALYLQHHYAIDLIWGASYALVSWLLTDKIFFSWIEEFIRRTIASSQNQVIDELNPLT